MVFDPRNPSGEKRTELPRITRTEPAVHSNVFDPRNPSGRTAEVPVKPRLVNDTPFIGVVESAKYNLFINYYIDANADRQKEMVQCVIENAKNFDNIVVITDSQDSFDNIQSLVKKIKLIPVIAGVNRATYLEYFDLISVFNDPNNINVIANLDIVIPKETLINCVSYFNSPVKTVLALTRWDVKPDGSSEFYNHADSQDVWIFNGAVEKGVDANFNLGWPGCDNALANRLFVAGYEVLNPSLSLKIYHHHLVNIHTYLNEKGEQKTKGIPPPYKLLTPTT